MSELSRDNIDDMLKDLRGSGDDLTTAREVDFVYVMPDEASARVMGEAVRKLGYSVEIARPWSDPEWQVTCVSEIVPMRSNIQDAHRPLSDLAKEYGGIFDGWGCDDLSN